MKEYILKRLLWMTVTLFGIMVITFCVTRLAPGDPASLKLQGAAQSGSQQLSRKIIEDTRKLYGFDKPVLLNLRDDNVRSFTIKHIKEMQNADEYTRIDAEEALTEAGTATLPYLTELLNDSDYANQTTAILSVIKKISGVSYPSDSAEENRVYWIECFASKPLWHDEPTQQDVVELFMSESADQNSLRQTLIDAGTAVLARLMDAIFTVTDKKKQDAVVNLVAEIARKPWIIESSYDSAQRQNVLNKWRRWWQREKQKYTFFSPIERIRRVFTATQFAQWFGMVITLDFAESYSYHLPVTKLIKERLPISLQLSLISIFLTYIIAIPLGVFSATHQYTASDKVVTVLLFILYSLPSFWVANMLILLTTGGDFPHIFPSRYLHSPGAENFTFARYMIDWAWHLVLPVTCLTYASFAYISRQMRVGMLDIIRQDFIRTARAKGLSERTVIFKHALRNALIPTVTLLASLLPALLGGSVIIEEIFTIQGMGKLSFEAILNRDYPVINAIAFFSAFLTLLGMLITDIAYVIVDPRISFEK